MRALALLAVAVQLAAPPAFAEEKAGAAEKKYDMKTYYLGLLRRGPRWTPESTPETARLQEAHMAHIRSMADSGKLVIAGPLLDGGELRGVFVFNVGSLEEARALAEADPTVKAGRLAVEVHPWMAARGSTLP
jgi:uncharacterized protein